MELILNTAFVTNCAESPALINITPSACFNLLFEILQNHFYFSQVVFKTKSSLKHPVFGVFTCDDAHTKNRQHQLSMSAIYFKQGCLHDPYDLTQLAHP